MGRLHFSEVILRQPVRDVEIRILVQKQVSQRVHFRPLVVAFVELGLGKIWCTSSRLIFPSRLALSGNPVPQSRIRRSA